MFVEKRKMGNNIKYYLTHSYRVKTSVKKIRKFLGFNLNKTELLKLKNKAENEIIEKVYTDVFQFTLSNTEIEKLNLLGKKIKITPLDKDEWQRFTEKFVFNTNAIEGSTILEKEVHDILEKKNVIDPEEIETRGVAKALNYIKITNEDLSVNLIKKLHKLCFEGAKPFAGQIRKLEVVIRDGFGNIIHRGTPASELPKALEELVIWYNKNKNKFKSLVLASIIHNQFEHIHPFQDGNGRVGRLLLNFVLLKNKYPPINISLEDRGEYYQCLRKYDNTHDVVPTVKFLIKEYQKSLRWVTTKKK